MRVFRLGWINEKKKKKTSTIMPGETVKLLWVVFHFSVIIIITSSFDP